MLIHAFLCRVTAEQASEMAHVDRNTANLWYRHFRELISINSVVPRFYGEVEIDHAYVGGLQKRKGSRGNLAWSTNKITVFGIYKRHEVQGTLYTQIVPNVKNETLLPIIKRVVEKGSTIYSDCWRGFATLPSEGYIHHTVNHSAGVLYNEETKAHTGYVDGFWSVIKRRYDLLNGIPAHTFPLFLKECEFRYNHRETKGGVKLAFEKMLREL